jgi:hypothetical protein
MVERVLFAKTWRITSTRFLQSRSGRGPGDEELLRTNVNRMPWISVKASMGCYWDTDSGLFGRSTYLEKVAQL